MWIRARSLSLAEMTPKAHMKIDKIDDKFQNLRQYFDIYPNIDNQKTKK